MQTYYENTALSQSKLKLLLLDPQLFNTDIEPDLFFEEKEHFIIGSAVDCKLTTPQNWDTTYYVSDLENKPTDVIKKILHKLFEELKEVFSVENIHPLNFTSYRPMILTCCNLLNYYPNLLDDTRINKVLEHYEYWELLKNSDGKQILSVKEQTIIDAVVMSLKTNEITSKYFTESRYIEIVYQKDIYFKYNNVECKALLDMVIVDHMNETIQPIDIKTIGDYTINFPKSLRKRRYDIQAAFYTEAIKKEMNMVNYKILPFKFIVESTVKVGNPLVYTCDKTLLEMGKSGRETMYSKATIFDESGQVSPEEMYVHRIEKINGFEQLIELYKYYTEKGFSKSKIINDNNSELTLDWSGII